MDETRRESRQDYTRRDRVQMNETRRETLQSNEQIIRDVKVSSERVARDVTECSERVTRDMGVCTELHYRHESMQIISYMKCESVPQGNFRN